MQSRVLKSIVEITRHRDLDSLELAFVATLKEMLPVDQIGLFHVSTEGESWVEEIVMLGTDDAAEFRWNGGPHLVAASPELRSTLDTLTVSSRDLGDDRVEWYMPIACGGKPNGAVVLRGGTVLNDHVELIDGLARVYSNYMTILHEAEHDKLTGLLNRRTFDDTLDRLLRSQRGRNSSATAQPNLPAWMAVIDLDYFKRVNDSYGHVYGDEILLLVAQAMREYFEPRDLLFRVGGEEFVVAMAPQTRDLAEAKLEGFRELLANREFPQGMRITASIGYAEIRRGDFPKRIYSLADKALYYAKENGRNRVCSYESLLAEGHFIEQDKSGSIELF
ncbi:MAG: GGDEF domain-containing protein [Pseudomonadota bacterium]